MLRTKVLPKLDEPVRATPALEGSLPELLKAVRDYGFEGLIAKRRDSLYEAGQRSGSWRKMRVTQGQEFVIGGYTRPGGSREIFGALLVGYHRPDGKLAYAGRVGTGFDRATLRSLGRRMHQLEQQRAPFADLPGTTKIRGVHWLKPELVAQVEFNNWTKDGLLRQAAFQGLRDDKPPRAIVRERAVNAT